MSLHICVYVCITYVCIDVYTYVCMYDGVCMYVCICIFNAYINTHQTVHALKHTSTIYVLDVTVHTKI